MGCFYKNNSVLAFATTLVIGATVLHANDSWNQFRGASGTGWVHSSKLPTQWDADTTFVFRTPLSGKGWSSPVIANGTIYLTAAIEGDKGIELSLLAFSATKGNELWRKMLILQGPGETKKIHGKNTHASPTPIIEGDRIYVHFGYQGTVCVDLQGNIIWTNRGLSFPAVHGNGGSPIVVDDQLVFTCDGAKDPYVVALNKQTGYVTWKCKRPVDATKKFSFCTPTVINLDGKKRVIAPGSDCVVAIDPEAGDVIWSVTYDGYSVVPKPCFHEGLLYVCTGFDAGSLLAIDPTGSGDVTDTHVKWRLDRGVPKTPSLVYHAGFLYMISDNGVAECMNAQTGERVWRQRVGGNYSASPVVTSDGKIYFTSEEGVTTVVRAGNEYEELSRNQMGERTLASFGIDGNAIIMRTEEALYRIK